MARSLFISFSSSTLALVARIAARAFFVLGCGRRTFWSRIDGRFLVPMWALTLTKASPSANRLCREAHL